MKYVIPKGRTTEKVIENMISTVQIDTRKIIVVDQFSEAIGLLTKMPDGRYYVTDLLASRNMWPGTVRAEPSETLDLFNSVNYRIYQFDDTKEFVRWLAKKLEVKTLSDPMPRKRDKFGRFCSSEPKII